MSVLFYIAGRQLSTKKLLDTNLNISSFGIYANVYISNFDMFPVKK